MKSCWAILRGIRLFSLMALDETGREFMIQSREKLVINADRKPLDTALTAANVAWSKDSIMQLHYAPYVCPRSSDGLTYEKNPSLMNKHPRP